MPSTQMRREIKEIPGAVEALLMKSERTIQDAASTIRDRDIRFLVSVARGSSDHACTFLKYASELLLGLPMASLGPSVASVYGARLRVKDALCLAVSQSGQSPDIVRMTKDVTEEGAFSVAITNADTSPLAAVSSVALPIHAGLEMSVAATKTFVSSLVAGLWLLAEIRQDAALLAAIRALPEQLERAAHCDWSPVAESISGHSLFSLGRGPSWAISNEAALKFKETCQIHAESYSSAEVMHGPVSIVDAGFTVLAFASADAAEDALVQIVDGLADRGAHAFATSRKVKHATCLDHVRTDHWLTDPIATIVSFYAMVEMIAVDRGIDPDRPRHLNKITETI